MSTVRVDGGPDVADIYIAEHATAGDVAVTADIPLAACWSQRASWSSTLEATNTLRTSSASDCP